MDWRCADYCRRASLCRITRASSKRYATATPMRAVTSRPSHANATSFSVISSIASLQKPGSRRQSREAAAVKAPPSSQPYVSCTFPSRVASRQLCSPYVSQPPGPAPRSRRGPKTAASTLLQCANRGLTPLQTWPSTTAASNPPTHRRCRTSLVGIVLHRSPRRRLSSYQGDRRTSPAAQSLAGRGASCHRRVIRDKQATA
jgi:hypothetical protein